MILHRLRFGLCAAALMLAACGEDGTQQSQDTGTTGQTEQTGQESSALAGSNDTESGHRFGDIDRERLLNADKEPGNWFTNGRGFGENYYSPLDQINRDNVDRLGLAWEFETFTRRGMEATPTVVDGVMYTSGPLGRVYALDAETGEEIWFFDPEADRQHARYACCGEINRGVQVYDGMVYVGAYDGILYGLDAETGEVVWEQDTFIYEDRAYTSSGAPQVAGDVVVLGNAGADFDARGYISAYDLKTGAFQWRFFTVPGDPEDGFEHPEMKMAAETWDPDSRWDVGGGGTVWDAMAYDPELNLLYVGTGNAALFNWEERSPAGGDNLFLASVLAINPDTGRLVWHYQEVPKERWDYTSTQPMILTEMEIDGEARKVLMHAPKNGFFYIFDRETGEVLEAHEFVPQNWSKGLDPETGEMIVDEEAANYADEPKLVYPSGMGGHNWHPMAYSPDTGLVYIPAIEGVAIIADFTDGHEYEPKRPNSGNFNLWGDALHADPANFSGEARRLLEKVQKSGMAESRAVLKAFDPLTGETVWEEESVGWWDRSGVLATAGGLVFKGTDTGYFKAYDDRTGEELLSIKVGTSMMAAPMTYTIDGEQYIAIQAGWGGGGWFMPHEPSAAYKYGNENRILAFKLDGGEVPVPDPLPEPAPIPEPPEQTASEETIARGGELFGSNCTLCHANHPRGMTPDLRRMSPQTHQNFNDIVLDGARRPLGMPQWDDVLDEKDAEAIHAYLIDLSWQAYEAEQEEAAQ